MKEIDALKLALKKEERSIKLYQKLLGKYPALKNLLCVLIEEEQQHKKLINKKIREFNNKL